jgi:transposase
MARRLRGEEIVTIEVLAEKGQNHCEIARTLGVTEGAVRYHLRRRAEGATDGRKDKPFKAEELAGVIEHWVQTHEASGGSERPVNVRELFDYLVAEYGYEGHYRSLLRYMRVKYPKPKRRTYRRVETPPGAQSQTDWGEYPRVDVGEGPEALHAFVLVLSHSRMPAVIWSRREDQLSWLHCHNEAFRRLAGIAAVNRIDNVKTAIAKGAGAWGTIHPVYRSYARGVGFHIDACPPRAANAKGKVEAKVRLTRLRLDPKARRFEALEELQERTDQRIEGWARQARCPATGVSVWESWQRELERLRPLPILPEPFDVVVTRRVGRDCTVRFEDRSYAVPFPYVDRRVEVRGCAEVVQILADGAVLRTYPRKTPERILLDPSCFEGEATDRVLAPPPLGRMGKKLQELYELPVDHRPLDLYAALAEVAR